MAENNLHQPTVSSTMGGLHTESSYVDQPKNTHRFALNAVNISKDGKQRKLSNEPSNIATGILPDGFINLGNRYTEDGESVVILVNSSNGKEQIGVINKNDKYTTLVDTTVLNLNEANQCDIIYRLRRGKERVIYWVDGNNLARTFNLDKPQDFHNQTYKNYLRAGNNPDTFLGEKWDASSFDLIKSYSIVPFFSNVQILETGSILPGSYNFAIQLIDEDLNPTQWINVSNTVNIYNDSTNNSFQRIRGSKNVDNSAQSFPRASKSIKLTITNLDDSFPYYRIAIIRAAGVNGVPDKVLISDIVPTSDSNFIYSGNDGSLIEGSLGEILIGSEVIYAPKHIEQIENRLTLANTKGKGINWCEFQKYASKIKTDLVTKEIILNNILSEPNIKNPKSTFFYGGYMPGEVHAFNINFLFNDGYISPGFHIPGRDLNDNTTYMGYYETNYTYLDIHNCSTDNYWGKDWQGETLVGKRVRHHRFPFRKDVNKPLYTKSTSVTIINKNRLTITISLNPDYTPDPIYPVDINDDPLVIPFTINYNVNGSTTDINFNGLLTDTGLDTVITIYNDITELTQIDAPEYFALDPSSALAAYQSPGNDLFIITGTYETYVVDSSIDSDKAEIFGINFSNIEVPHPDVIGFYITRAEKTDDDKLIVDNAIFGIMTQFEQYVSFSHLMPKQFYIANNCSFEADAGKTLQYYDKGVWFFNPEYQFLNKKTEFDTIEIEGKYTETTIDMPTISNVENRACNKGYSKGVYISDVQAGTSFNPDINKKKDKDDDGFDLLIGYRNTNVEYDIVTGITMPYKKRVYYMNATHYQNLDSNTFYNISVDNKIGMYLSDDIIDTELFFNTGDNKNGLLYGSLVKENSNLYSNFQTRPYYKEHNNPILFDGVNVISNIQIFNGDADISAVNIVNSIYYDMVVADRSKKSKVWAIIAGAVLVVGGVLLSIFGGAGVPAVALGISVLAGLAVSYGISLVVSGIKFEQFKAMVDVDYEKGLKETVVDGGVFETIRDTIEKDDDTIRWFVDRVSNVYIESCVPVGLRSGVTAGVSDFIDAPAPYDELAFRTHITEKLTILDREQGSGRLYKGYAGAEYYDINPDYMRFNKQKIFTPLAIEYDCCTDRNEVYPMRCWASEQSFQEEKTDNYRTFLPNNYIDVEGEHGEITDLYRFGNNLFIHTKEALFQLPQSNQERVTNEIVSFLGTGGFFAIPPRKIIDSTLGSGGSQHKWATIKTPMGVFFLNEVEHNIYVHSDKPKDISSEDNYSWFQENLRSFLADQLYSKLGINYERTNNPASKNGIGYISTLDTKFKRVLFTKRDYLILEDKLAELEVVSVIPVAGDDFVFSLQDNNFYKGTTQLSFDNTTYFINKSWTISYSLLNGKFISMHSYIPNSYIHNQNKLYSTIVGSNRVWRHNEHGSYHVFYNKEYPFIVEYVNTNQIPTQSLEYITLQTEARRLINNQFIEEKFITFNKILVYNTSQSSGIRDMVIRDTSNDMQNFLFNQIKNTAGQFLITRRAKDWNINNLRDFVIDNTKPLFTDEWSRIKANYYIDKVVNPDVIDYNKPWNQLAVFQDKFAVIRLIFDNFSNINLILNFTIETEQDSTF